MQAFNINKKIVVAWMHSHLRTFLGCLAAAGALGSPAQAQLSERVAACAELREPAFQNALSACSAHTGCSMILKLQMDCANARQFLKKLATALAGKSSVTNNDVFEANSVTLMTWPVLTTQVAGIQKMVRDSINEPGRQKVETNVGGIRTYYEGRVVNDHRDGIGVSIKADGVMERGQYARGGLNGQAQVIDAEGLVFAGGWAMGQKSGFIVEQNLNGVVRYGQYASDKRVGAWEGWHFAGSTSKTLYSNDGKFLSHEETPAPEVAQVPSPVRPTPPSPPLAQPNTPTPGTPDYQPPRRTSSSAQTDDPKALGGSYRP